MEVQVAQIESDRNSQSTYFKLQERPILRNLSGEPHMPVGIKSFRPETDVGTILGMGLWPNNLRPAGIVVRDRILFHDECLGKFPVDVPIYVVFESSGKVKGRPLIDLSGVRTPPTPTSGRDQDLTPRQQNPDRVERRMVEGNIERMLHSDYNRERVHWVRRS